MTSSMTLSAAEASSDPTLQLLSDLLACCRSLLEIRREPRSLASTAREASGSCLKSTPNAAPLPVKQVLMSELPVSQIIPDSKSKPVRRNEEWLSQWQDICRKTEHYGNDKTDPLTNLMSALPPSRYKDAMLRKEADKINSVSPVPGAEYLPFPETNIIVAKAKVGVSPNPSISDSVRYCSACDGKVSEVETLPVGPATCCSSGRCLKCNRTLRKVKTLPIYQAVSSPTKPDPEFTIPKEIPIRKKHYDTLQQVFNGRDETGTASGMNEISLTDLIQALQHIEFNVKKCTDGFQVVGPKDWGPQVHFGIHPNHKTGSAGKLRPSVVRDKGTEIKDHYRGLTWERFKLVDSTGKRGQMTGSTASLKQGGKKTR